MSHPSRPRRLAFAAPLAAAGACLLSPRPAPARRPRGLPAGHARRGRGPGRPCRPRPGQGRAESLEPGPHGLHSDVTVEVVRAVGSADARARAGGTGEVTLRVPGGEVGGVGMGISHASRERVGEGVLVFPSVPSAAAPEAAWLEAGGRTLAVAGGDEAWLPVRSGEVDLAGGRKAPVAEPLAAAATSLRKQGPGHVASNDTS